MVVTLQHPEIYTDGVKGVVKMLKTIVQCASYNTIVTFIDNDLLLGSKPHNRPLFVTGYVKEEKVDLILVDIGSTINIMQKSMVHDLGITIEELLKTWMM